MDNLFYAGVSLLFIGMFSLARFIAYKIGVQKGRREYYNLLTNPDEENRIQ
ncbi:MAG TPA: hypothetical protein PKE38_18310 [Ignavibacteriaceae bacterium]|nr:hypothetical protein [Ignavibacteriaceae bacterium]